MIDRSHRHAPGRSGRGGATRLLLLPALLLVIVAGGLLGALGSSGTMVDVAPQVDVVEATAAVQQTAFSVRDSDVRGRGLDRLPVLAVLSLVVAVGASALAAGRTRLRPRSGSGSGTGPGVASRAPPACA